MAIESESDNSETATSNVTILKSLLEKKIHYKQIIGLHFGDYFANYTI